MESRYEVRDKVAEKQDPNAVYLVLRLDRTDTEWGRLSRHLAAAAAATHGHHEEFAWLAEVQSYLQETSISRGAPDIAKAGEFKPPQARPPKGAVPKAQGSHLARKPKEDPPKAGKQLEDGPVLVTNPEEEDAKPKRKKKTTTGTDEV